MPENQCGTERVLPERLARPNSQACTRIAGQPEVPVLVPWRAHLQRCSNNLMAKQGPRAQARAPGLARVKIKSRDDHVEQKCWYR